MRIDGSTSVMGVIGKWICLAGLAGMAALYAMVTFAPRLLDAVADATFNRTLTLALGMFGVGFAVWMFTPEPRSTRRFWKIGLFTCVVLGGLAVVARKYGLLPAAMDATAIATWLCLCGMAAIVCARRWHTLDDTRDAVSRWAAARFPAQAVKGADPGAGASNSLEVPSAMLAGILLPQHAAAIAAGDPAMTLAAHHAAAAGFLFSEHETGKLTDPE